VLLEFVKNLSQRIRVMNEQLEAQETSVVVGREEH
jgi:hypothetical protein